MDFIQGTLHVEGEQHRSSSRPRDGDEPHKEHLGGRILGRESPTNSGLVGDLVGFCGLTPASRQSIRCITRLSYQRTSHFGHFTYSRHIGGQRRVVPGGCTPSPGSSRSRVQQANAHCLPRRRGRVRLDRGSRLSAPWPASVPRRRVIQPRSGIDDLLNK
jgi:hypothetical protein